MSRMRDLHSINRDITNSLDQAEILQRLVRKTAELTRAEVCMILLSGPDGQLRVAASLGGDAARLSSFSAPLNEEIRNAVRELVDLGDGSEFLGVPIAHDGRILGLLTICRQVPFVPDTVGEEALLLALADQAAIALEHAGRLERLEAAANAAAAAEARFRSLFESAPDPILIVRQDGSIMLANGEAERCFGYASGELLQLSLPALIPERYRTKHTQYHGAYFHNPQLRPMGLGSELYAQRKDRSEFPVEVSLSPLLTPDGLLVTATVRDITERRQIEVERARLLQSEQQKSKQLALALREAHHRIKNNLQAVTNLLSLGMASQSDAAQGELLRDSIERVQAIALVHDLLSQEADVQTVDTRELVERLVPHVLRSLGLTGNGVQVQVSALSTLLPSKQATALALVLNELVSNAAKHAFTDGRKGLLQVSLDRNDNRLLLRVQDNGPGLPLGFDLDRHTHVGLQVVSTLVTNDLKGELRLENSEGLIAEVSIPA